MTKLDPRVASWLRSLALLQYEADFQSHKITYDLLPHLTARGLEGMGVNILQHRLFMLNAVEQSKAKTIPQYGYADDEHVIAANFESFLSSARLPMPILAALIFAVWDGQGTINVLGIEVSTAFGAQVLSFLMISLSIYLAHCLRMMDGTTNGLRKRNEKTFIGHTSQVQNSSNTSMVYRFQLF